MSPLPSEVDNVGSLLPILKSCDYFIKPSLDELARREHDDAGFCSKVLDFTVGRSGYGKVKFFGETDIRWLNLDELIRFSRHEVVVYEDESSKPEIGQGLNKAAEVTLVINLSCCHGISSKSIESFVANLKAVTEKQGAEFVSFDAATGEWKFRVNHFSRFGLAEDDEDDILIDDAINEFPSTSKGRELALSEQTTEEEKEEEEESDQPREMLVDEQRSPIQSDLSHSLPTHLGLDPQKMQQMRKVMFSGQGEEAEDVFEQFSRKKQSLRKQPEQHDANGSQFESVREFPSSSRQKKSHRISPAPMWGTLSPQSSSRLPKVPLLEYNVDSPSSIILMSQQNKEILSKIGKSKGFRLDLNHETPVRRDFDNVVDAGLFMGRSFRVGWGPNGLLVHTGAPVGKSGLEEGLSSIIKIEKVALDRTVTDETNQVRKELVDLRFDIPLKLHMSLETKTNDIAVGSFKLKLRRVRCNQTILRDVCRRYTDIVEKQFDILGLRQSDRVILMHQVMIWELIKVLFSEIEVRSSSSIQDSSATMDVDEETAKVEPEAEPFVRRAQFSSWLQESVSHLVQEQVSYVNDTNTLRQIFSYMSGRRLETAVEMAASRGDVRLACLLSLAGGSMANRSDMTSQLEVWRSNGLDTKFIENDRLRLYQLLAGDIQGALLGSEIDWKRYIGLIMWYQLKPESSLAVIIGKYEQLLDQELAPNPVPVYIEERLAETTDGHCDMAYYLMLLHANKINSSRTIKTMFSSFSSTFDALDYHIIWHQREILQAINAFTFTDLYLLDMSLVSQLLCLGLCHWAIYVVLHLPQHPQFPDLHASAIRDILFQYCEVWSSQESQCEFIKALGVPSEWMHEALAVYYQYYGDHLKAFQHLLECSSWQRAHVIFMTMIAHSLFLSSEDSTLWRLAISMEAHKSEIADWNLGAGIYVDFYLLRDSLRGGETVEGSVENQDQDCNKFFSRLKRSLVTWGSKLPLEAKAVYAKMADELGVLLMSSSGGASTYSDQMSCFQMLLTAPLPEDRRSCHLQDALSAFTFCLKDSSTMSAPGS